MYPEYIFWFGCVLVAFVVSVWSNVASRLLLLASFVIVILLSGDNYPDYHNYFDSFQRVHAIGSQSISAEPGYNFFNYIIAYVMRIGSYRFSLLISLALSAVLVSYSLSLVFRKVPIYLDLVLSGTSLFLLFVSSPRSGLGIAFALSSILFFISSFDPSRNKYVLAFRVFIAGILAVFSVTIHSQYVIVLVLTIVGVYIYSYRFSVASFVMGKLNLSIALFIVFAVLILALFLAVFPSIFSYASGKLGVDLLSGEIDASRLYAERYNNIRYTFLLGPISLLLLASANVRKRLNSFFEPISQSAFMATLITMSMSSIAINCFFYFNSYLAGRLSRLSEYSLIVLLPFMLPPLRGMNPRSCLAIYSLLICVAYQILYREFWA